MAATEYEPSWEKRMARGHETRIGVTGDHTFEERLLVTRHDSYSEVRDEYNENICVEDRDAAKLALALGVTCGEGCTGNGCSLCAVRSNA
jgi:hypothetical protein